MKVLKPFFSYYGSKYIIGKHYAPPAHDTLIEPFAGSACYSLRHYRKNVILYDLNPKICMIWEYLIRVSPEEIMQIPLDYKHLDELNVIPEVRALLSFWNTRAAAYGSDVRSSWTPNFKMGAPTPEMLHRVATQVPYIRHWRIVCDSYKNIDNTSATWFIDPPYQGIYGSKYKCNDIDYKFLGEWCRAREGQVIVCEREGADWLPFEHFRLSRNASRTKNHNEVVYLQG